MSGRLQDKVALITGASSGIGRATAIEFAREGADVAINYLSDEDAAGEVAKAIEELGRRALVVQGDVSREEDVEAMFERVLSQLGALNILVNNAGVDSGDTPVCEMGTDQFEKTLRVDLYGVFFCCRSFVRHRIRQGGGGKIVNVSSVHQRVPRIGGADYDAAKAAVGHFTRTLALESAEHCINVNAIAPGMIMTSMNEAAQEDEQLRREMEASIPWKRAGQPEEVARLVVFLASNDADYITGASHFIDGGLQINQGQGA